MLKNFICWIILPLLYFILSTKHFVYHKNWLAKMAVFNLITYFILYHIIHTQYVDYYDTRRK